MFTIDVRVDRHGTQPIPLTEGIGEIMRKIAIIFLSVMVLTISGCGNKKADVAVNTETKESVTQMNQPESEEISKKESETEEVKATETESVTEESDQTAQEQMNSNTAENEKVQEPAKTENKTPEKTSQTTDVQPEKQEEVKPEPEAPVKEPEQPQAPARVEYSSQNVVALATAKTKAAGKVLLTENLDNMLASGQISQEEYNEYYPYDGAGYYSVFVDSNMAEARSVSGSTKFNSEDDIAQYIADMLVLESGPYFLIEYAGTYDYYGKQCYEFRCYRA